MPGLKADRTRKNDPAEFINMQVPNNRTRYNQVISVVSLVTTYKISNSTEKSCQVLWPNPNSLTLLK